MVDVTCNPLEFALVEVICVHTWQDSSVCYRKENSLPYIFNGIVSEQVTNRNSVGRTTMNSNLWVGPNEDFELCLLLWNGSAQQAHICVHFEDHGQFDVVLDLSKLAIHRLYLQSRVNEVDHALYAAEIWVNRRFEMVMWLVGDFRYNLLQHMHTFSQTGSSRWVNECCLSAFIRSMQNSMGGGERAKNREKTRNVIYGWRPKGKERNRDTLICMALSRKQSTFCLHVIEKWLSSTLLLTINTVGI